MSDTKVNITVLTLNVWGIFNSRYREARMAHLASKVGHYDVILLQEQFTASDFNIIIASLPPEVRASRYFRRFPSAFYGSGCAVISKYPIRSAFFHTYPLQGYPEMFLHGDFFANKGAAVIKVEVPYERDGAVLTQEVVLYTTHLVAIYQKVSQLPSWKQERYLPYRLSQALSLANFIKNTSKPTDYVIIGGDFNSSQRSLEVQMLLILLKRWGYHISSVLPAPSSILEFARSEEERALAAQLHTFSRTNPFNSMKTSYFKLLHLEADIPSQIDHIFFSNANMQLQRFDDCRDVAPQFPKEIVLDGAAVPSGLVVFTDPTEVLLPPPVRWPTRAAVGLQRWCGESKSRAARALRFVAYWLHAGATQQDNPAQPSFADGTACPLSDHFGVAARFQLDIPPSAEAAAAGAAHDDARLTEEEALVEDNVVEFLNAFVRKLRNQVFVTKVTAATSIAIFIINVWTLRRLLRSEEQRIALTLQQVFAMGSSSRLDVAGSTPPEESADSSSSLSFGAIKKTAVRCLHLFHRCPPHDVQARRPPLPDFAGLAKELTVRPLWSSVGVSSLITIVSTSGAAAALSIGVFQRAGNANILEEQVHQLRISRA